MVLQFTKRKDGRSVLRCVRPDGSSTWQRHQASQAAFFPIHDLTHYAVETVLGFHSGFFGLLAEGWEIEETTGKGDRGPLPDEAIEVEYIVGALSAERAGDPGLTAEEFNRLAFSFAKARGRPRPRPLTNPELTQVRVRITELAMQWRALPPGETLELPFPP